jgi:hypothetical protein
LSKFNHFSIKKANSLQKNPRTSYNPKENSIDYYRRTPHKRRIILTAEPQVSLLKRGKENFEGEGGRSRWGRMRSKWMVAKARGGGNREEGKRDQG